MHADHVTLLDKREFGIDDNRAALALKDDATGFRGFYAQQAKAALDTTVSLRHFMGKVPLKVMRSDNSKELLATASEMRLVHETATPYTPSTNTRIEREIGVILGGTRTNLQHSGLSHKFWPYAASHFCHYANCTLPYSSGQPLADLPASAKTPWKARHEEEWSGPSAPFGCLVDFRTPDAPSFRKCKFSGRTQPGLFLGVVLQPGLHYR